MRCRAAPLMRCGTDAVMRTRIDYAVLFIGGRPALGADRTARRSHWHGSRQCTEKQSYTKQIRKSTLKLCYRVSGSYYAHFLKAHTNNVLYYIS